MELRTFLYSQAIVAVAVLVSDICAFVFYGLALQFPPDQFAEVASITALNFVVTVVAATMGTYVVMRSKERGVTKDVSVGTMRLGVSVALLVALLFAAASPLLQRFFHFTSPIPFVILGVAALPAVLTNILQSMLLSKRRFGMLALGIIAFGAGRIPAGFLLFSDGYASTDAPFALAIAGLIGLLVTLLGNGNLASFRSLLPALPTFTEARAIAELLWSILIVGALLKIDILWAKHGLPSDKAGVYGMTSLIASVLYYVTMGIARASSAYLTRQNLRKISSVSLGIILTACAVCVAGYFLIGHVIFAKISDHASDLETLPLLLLFAAMTGYSVLGFAMQCLGVLHRSVHVQLMTGVVFADLLLLWFLGGTMLSIATIQATTLIAGALVSVALLLWHTAKRA